MKYGLLVVSKGIPRHINIGDYVQSLAAAQYLPSVDVLIEREEVSEYQGDDVAVIMNAWYMHNPSAWPPSNKIYPLYVSIHINSSIYHEFSDPAVIKSLKQYEPIGCRDGNTLKFLRENDVASYFSGCLTLTLGRQYKSTKKDDMVYFVDPAIAVTRGTGIIAVLRWGGILYVNLGKSIRYLGKNMLMKERD